MPTPKAVYIRNRKVLSEYRKFLDLMPKTVLFFAADYALSLVMSPDTKNYGAGEVSGDKMPANSSNAAWNWRVSFNGPQKPLVDFGKDPVAGVYDRPETKDNPKGYTLRSTYAFDSAIRVIQERRDIDISTKLYNKLFSKPYSKIPKTTVYNTIDQLNFGKNYVDNSNVKAASAKLETYASLGVNKSYVVLRNFERGGVYKAVPNVLGLKARLAQTRGEK